MILKGHYMSAEARKLVAKACEDGWNHGLTAEQISIIAQHPKSAKIYAQKVLQSRFPAGEPYIAQNACESYLYAKDVLHGKFPLGEPAIAKSAKYSLLYAKYTGRFQAGEQAIIDEFLENDNPEYVLEYTNLTGVRFEEAENKFALNAKDAYKYALTALVGIFEKGEKVISQDAECSVPYAARFIKKKWPEAEEQISKSPQLSFEYARKFGPFTLGEESIAKNSEHSFRYARDILKKRFEKGENEIAKDARLSYAYAKEVIKGRFEEAEETIRANSLIFILYARFILEKDGEVPENWHNQLLIMGIDDKSSSMKEYFAEYKRKQDVQKLRLVQHLTVQQLREIISKVEV